MSGPAAAHRLLRSRQRRPARRGLAAALAVALAAVAACVIGEARVEANVLVNPRALDSVHRSTLAAPAVDRPRLALVLGGGGLRGFAHVGVLRALDEAGIRPDIVVGTSVGALVGAVYASGATVAQIEAAAHDIDVTDLIDWTLDPGGLMRGRRIANWVDGATRGLPIEDFPIRFGAVATELRSGTAMLLDQGLAGDAVRASAAVPGAIVPVQHHAGQLVDGGVSSLVPVRFARAMGADTVVAVEIYCNGPGTDGLGTPTVVRRSMQVQTCLLAEQELELADVVIRPRVAAPPLFDPESRRDAVHAGYESAKAAIAEWEAGERGQEVESNG